MRVVVAQKVVMQTRFLVEVLGLQAERLVRGPLGVAVAVVNKKLRYRGVSYFLKIFSLSFLILIGIYLKI